MSYRAWRIPLGKGSKFDSDAERIPTKAKRLVIVDEKKAKFPVVGSSKLPPMIAREQIGDTVVVTVVVTVETEVIVLAERVIVVVSV
jgi:hypothetical protein